MRRHDLENRDSDKDEETYNSLNYLLIFKDLADKRQEPKSKVDAFVSLITSSSSHARITSVMSSMRGINSRHCFIVIWLVHQKFVKIENYSDWTSAQLHQPIIEIGNKSNPS